MSTFKIAPVGVDYAGQPVVDVTVNDDLSLYETPRRAAERWIAERCEDRDTVISPEGTETGGQFHQRRSRSCS